MPRRELHNSHNADLFGHNSRPRRRRLNVPTPSISRKQALRISQGLGFFEHPAPPQPPSHVEDKTVWEDIADNFDHPEGNNNDRWPDDPSGNRYAQHQKELRHADARENRAKKWLALQNILIAKFLHLQYHTLNWTTKDDYLFEEVECHCSPEKGQKRYFDLIDILVKSLSLFFIVQPSICYLL